MRSVRKAIVIGFAIFLGIAQASAGEFDSILHWRNIGPYRGGRTRAICGVPSQPNVFYMAPVNGGVFKSIDYGRTWQPIFDDQPTASVGAIAVAHQVRMSFTLAAVKDCIGRIFQLVMAFINRLTPEKRGRISDCAMVSRSRNWPSIQKMRTASLWP
jgi:hypothetical protein